jgi:hypothetical protein
METAPNKEIVEWLHQYFSIGCIENHSKIESTVSLFFKHIFVFTKKIAVPLEKGDFVYVFD